jgi:glyoxylase-like metal-dependent hydrolase (beta-lactamase superfamily II)
VLAGGRELRIGLIVLTAEDGFTRCQSMFGQQIAPGVHQIGPARAGLGKGGYSRAYLFEDDNRRLTLVDTGWDGDARFILRYLESIGRSPEQIDNIALTHAHRSHLGGLATLKALSRAKVSSHAEEAPIIEGTKRAHPIRLWPPLPLSLILFRVISYLPIFEHERCKVDRQTLAEGDRVGPLTVLHTPGHTRGHLAFRYRATKVLIVGDAVATWPKFGPGWPGFNLDETEYRRSLLRLVDCAPDVIGPGHGDSITDGTAARLSTLVKGRKFSSLRARA